MKVTINACLPFFFRQGKIASRCVHHRPLCSCQSICSVEFFLPQVFPMPHAGILLIKVQSNCVQIA